MARKRVSRGHQERFGSLLNADPRVHVAVVVKAHVVTCGQRMVGQACQMGMKHPYRNVRQ